MDECTTKAYADTRFILPASNICESLFSTAGCNLSDRREGLNSMNLEARLFLHCNKDLLNVTDLNEETAC